MIASNAGIIFNPKHNFLNVNLATISKSNERYRKCEKIKKSAATNYCIATERSAEI
jgi:hypothetical protein